MGVTMLLCTEKECDRVLNGELCKFLYKKPYCEEHYKKQVEAIELLQEQNI